MKADPALNININYPLLIASLECGPQLDPPPCHQVGSGPPPVPVPLPALGFDLLVAGSIALGGAACCVLPMSSAGLKNPLSSLLLFSEFLRRFQGQKLPPLWLTIYLLLPLHFAHFSCTVYVQGPAAKIKLLVLTPVH